MKKEVENITCPKYPDHGTVTKQWLPPDQREQITKEGVEYVFKVDCPHCGQYEYVEERAPNDWPTGR
jgi:hypothetical protein